MLARSRVPGHLRPPHFPLLVPHFPLLVHPRCFPLLFTRAHSQAAPFNRVLAEYRKLRREVPSRELLDTLRDLFLRRKLLNDPKQQYLSEAHETLSLLCAHPEYSEKVKLCDIEKVLSNMNSHAWAAIHRVAKGEPNAALTKMTEEQAAAAQFLRIYRVGRVLANKLAKAGMRTFEDVAAAEPDGSRSLNSSMRLAIEHLPDLEHMIPIKEMDAFKGRIEDVFYGSYPAVDGLFQIAGPYRCGEPYSPDINIVVWSDSFEDPKQKSRVLDDAYKRLIATGLLTKDKVLSTSQLSDRRRVSGYTRLSKDSPWRLITFSLVPVPALPFEMLAQTGDGFLWRLLRTQAKLSGYRLSQTKMERLDNPEDSVNVESEKEIFDLVNVPYLEPHQRMYRVYRDILPPKILSAMSEPWENLMLRVAKPSESGDAFVG